MSEQTEAERLAELESEFIDMENGLPPETDFYKTHAERLQLLNDQNKTGWEMANDATKALEACHAERAALVQELQRSSLEQGTLTEWVKSIVDQAEDIGGMRLTQYLDAERLEQERAALVTERDELKRESDIWEKSSLLSILNELKQAEQERDALVTALEYARVCLLDWGQYASDYFKDKHDFDGDVARIDTALAAVRANPITKEQHESK